MAVRFCHMADFAQWLQDELNNRGWKPIELAKTAGVDSGLISRILNRERKPGPETARGIARALKLPPEIVFRQAGLLPPEPVATPLLEELSHRAALLSEEEQQFVIDYIDFILERRDRFNPQRPGKSS